ncbi:hypothetical protein NM688_g4171 [Phlebia brevispora]|uniref:Uncharacterized protein n=1 Tax=Phlebia brevispora TaxID=194682 RepID=A0ACC1T435_9APHY|nr:hypothetical protein NM688_g4171 [Phlebia brevispora]
MRFFPLIALSAFFAVAAACTPGTYICGLRPVNEPGSAIYVCDASGQYELVADCGDVGCAEENGGAYCD